MQPSYKPGVHLTDLQEKGRGSLPEYALDAIREACRRSTAPSRASIRPDAVLTGVETRTSSPLRIPRGKDYQSLNVRGLYPAGEGAGYAGGIMSAGVDGIEVAEALGAAMLNGLTQGFTTTVMVAGVLDSPRTSLTVTFTAYVPLTALLHASMPALVSVMPLGAPVIV